MGRRDLTAASREKDDLPRTARTASQADRTPPRHRCPDRGSGAVTRSASGRGTRRDAVEVPEEFATRSWALPRRFHSIVRDKPVDWRGGKHSASERPRKHAPGWTRTTDPLLR